MADLTDEETRAMQWRLDQNRRAAFVAQLQQTRLRPVNASGIALYSGWEAFYEWQLTRNDEDDGDKRYYDQFQFNA